MSEKPRVCIIGCGPSGMSALYHFSKLTDEERPDIVCFEKQKTWGGQWNPTWRTGTDEYGEMVHSAMYPHMMTNVPKESMEYPDYSFHQHLKRECPSYITIPTAKEYIEARMTNGGKNNLQRFIRFSTVVRKVEYHQDKQKFTVTVHNLPQDHIYDDSEFSHVIVAVGIFSVPLIPSISGVESFRGRICHSRDFRDLGEFKGKKILLLGSSYSAQDLAQATLKYGADRVICSWKTGPVGYKWSAGIEERPLVRNIVGNSVYFIDDTSAEVDVVIFCTGYRKYYPFLPDDLRLKGELSFYPDHLYKGILWMNGGNERLLYLGSQNQAFTLAMFDVQAFWACKYITCLLTVPDQKSMLQNIEYWKKKYEPVKDALGAINFQTDYVIDLANETGYKNKFKEHNVIYHLWFRHRNEDIGTFRDRQFTSVYSGILATPPKKPWLESFF